MPILFTPEISAEILHKIESKNWKVVYEIRNHGNPEDFQPIEDIFNQVADTLNVTARYHVYPNSIIFETFISGVINDTMQLPRVMINAESRIVFGFGIRDDHCFFVTNTDLNVRNADREKKDLQFMLDALDTLEPFSL